MTKLEQQLTQTATAILRKELIALEYKHLDKLNYIVAGYVGSVIESYLDEQGDNITEFVNSHAVHYAKHLKQDEATFELED